LLLLAIFVAAFFWRTLTFRYVQDLRRRRQLLQLRKLAVASVVSLVLVFDFTDELGTLATVVGLAAAGIAVALQNVILSFAGYFFVTGRYGIRVGDRIQLAGVNGDVIEIGLFKLALMELAGDGSTHQPTGGACLSRCQHDSLGPISSSITCTKGTTFPRPAAKPLTAIFAG